MKLSYKQYGSKEILNWVTTRPDGEKTLLGLGWIEMSMATATLNMGGKSTTLLPRIVGAVTTYQTSGPYNGEIM